MVKKEDVLASFKLTIQTQKELKNINIELQNQLVGAKTSIERTTMEMKELKQQSEKQMNQTTTVVEKSQQHSKELQQELNQLGLLMKGKFESII